MSAFVPPTLHQALTVTGLTRYMPPTELAALDFALRNGEASVVGPLLSDLANTIKDIPHSYPHATQGDAASVRVRVAGKFCDPSQDDSGRSIFKRH